MKKKIVQGFIAFGFSTELPSLCWRIKERITSCTYLSEHHIALHRNRAVKSMFVMKITQKYIVFLT